MHKYFLKFVLNKCFNTSNIITEEWSVINQAFKQCSTSVCLSLVRLSYMKCLLELYGSTWYRQYAHIRRHSNWTQVLFIWLKKKKIYIKNYLICNKSQWLLHITSSSLSPTKRMEVWLFFIISLLFLQLAIWFSIGP